MWLAFSHRVGQVWRKMSYAVCLKFIWSQTVIFSPVASLGKRVCFTKHMWAKLMQNVPPQGSLRIKDL